MSRTSKERLLIAALLAALAATGVALVLYWMVLDPAGEVAWRVPGMDGAPSREERLAALESEAVQIGEHFERFHEQPPSGGESWPMFRGPHRDNISRSSIPLLGDHPEDRPAVAWSVDLGEGHAAPAIHAGLVYLLDYDEELRADSLRCFALEDGRELWRRWYTVQVRRNHGMSRTVPAVGEDFVVTIGPRCHVMSVDPYSGDLLWSLDMVRELGAEVPHWYTGQCPLIDGAAVVLAPGGPETLLMGVSGRTGEVLWKTPNPHGWRMSHSSVMIATLGGRRQYVYLALGGVAGVAADGEDAGSLLWSYGRWAPAVAAPSPLDLGDDRLLLTSGYGSGGAVLQVTREGDAFQVERVAEYRPHEGLTSEQHTPILYEGHLFATLPKDAGVLRNQLVCSSIHAVQNFVWTSGRGARFGLGPMLIADGKLFVLSDDGLLTVVQASTGEYRELSRAQVLDGRDAWGPMALADGRLLVRDSMRMVCLDLRKDR